MKKTTKLYNIGVDCLPDSLDEFIKILKKVKKDNSKKYVNFTIHIDEEWGPYDDHNICLKICGEKVTK